LLKFVHVHVHVHVNVNVNANVNVNVNVNVGERRALRALGGPRNHSLFSGSAL